MNALILVYPLFSAAILPPSEIAYAFTAPGYVIGMKVTFLAPYSGRPLVFYSNLEPAKAICFSGDGQALSRCWKRFVGSVAIVTFNIKQPDGTLPNSLSIREDVTMLSRSGGLPARAPFSAAISVVDGTATDLQVFGYDESDFTRENRGSLRIQMREQWSVYSQSLYIGQHQKPFAIVQWKHTLDRISIVDVYAPPDPPPAAPQ